MSEETTESPSERKIARTISELLPLAEDSVRAVHITTPDNAESIIETGLDYEKYGMASSVARGWTEADEVEYGSADERFNSRDLKAVVMDVSNNEWKLHNNVAKSPGRISGDKVVGIVDIVTH